MRVIRIDPDQHRIGLSLRKVDSAAFADKDFKMLAREIDKLEEEDTAAVMDEEDEPVAEEPAEVEAPADVAGDSLVSPAEMPAAKEEPEAEKSTEPPTEPEA